MTDCAPRIPALLLALFALVLLPAPASGQTSQWLTWTDQTTSRLQLTTVSINDNQEKDMATADFDQDGDADLVIVRKLPFSNPGARTNLLLMNEGGVLVDRTQSLIPGFMVPDDARDVLPFDANGDGWLDLVVATTFFNQPRLFISQGQNAAGVFQGFVESQNWFSPLFAPGPKFCAVYDGDIDNDGDLDLYFSDYNNSLEDRLLINDGSGHFTDETAARFPTGLNNSVFGTASFIWDFNLDGWADILKVSGSFEPLKLLINDGTGHFTQVQVLPSTAVYMARTADFNNDGRRDFYVVSDQQDYQLINNSTNQNGTINLTQVFVSNSNKTTGFGGNVWIADLDRDGFEDVGVADVDVDIPGCNRRFAVLRNRLPVIGFNGLGDPNNPVNMPWNVTGVHDFAWIDIDGDGFLDLVQGRCLGYKVWMMQPFAVAEPYGQGCLGSNGLPIIGSNSAPVIGSTSFKVTLQHGAAGVAPVLAVSLSKDQVSFGSCDVLLGSPIVVGPAAPATNGAGNTQIPLPIPNTPLLEGFEIYAQWVIPDPNGALGGSFSLSNGLLVHLSANGL